MKKNLGVSLLFIFMLLLFPKTIFAAENWNVYSNTRCINSAYGTIYGANKSQHVTNCNNNDTVRIGGMYRCVGEYLGYTTGGLVTRTSNKLINPGDDPYISPEETVNDGNAKYTYYYFYDTGTVDTWTDENNPRNWIVGDALDIRVCPGMDLTYSTTTNIPNSLIGKKNLTLISVSTYDIMNSSYAKEAFKNDQARESIYKYKVNDNKLKIEPGTLDSARNEFSYKVTIDELIANDPGDITGLGVPGRRPELHRNVRAYHYLVPFVAIFRSENENYDPCKEQAYAYEHPEVCCTKERYDNETLYYPETCCGNKEIINDLITRTESNAYKFDLYNSSWNIKDTCCTNSEEYFVREGLATLKLFRYYKSRDSFFNDDFINRVCNNTCSWNPEDQNYCCYEDEYREDPRCITDNVCSDPIYFYNHTVECCGNPNSTFFQNNSMACCAATEGHINTSTWNAVCENKVEQSSGLVCQEFPTELTFSKNENGVTVTNTMKVDLANKTNNSSIRSVEAGRGFEYNLSITETLTIQGNPPDTNTIFYNRNDLENTVTNYKRKYDEMLDKYTEKRLSQQTISFKVSNDTLFKYDLTNLKNVNNKIINNNYVTNLSTSKNSYPYRYVSGTDRDGRIIYGTIEYRDIPVSSSITYKYTITPPMYYIKTNGTDSGTYNSKNNDDEYVEGGRLVYTSISSKSGYYPFSIEIKNGGISGEINTSGSGITCQYKLSNCLKEGQCDGEVSESDTPNYFRQISLSNPFPNREPGSNWQGNALNSSNTKVATYITEKGDNVYSNPMYHIKLTSSTISEIQRYNKNSSGYADWSTMNTMTFNEFSRDSNFLNCLSGAANRRNCGSLPVLSSDEISLPNLDNVRHKKIGDFITTDFQ